MPSHLHSAATVGKPSLRLRTTSGIIWFALQSVATRGVALLQQFVLVWLLAKEDFGLIGLAYSVSMFVNLLANPGIDGVLIQRQRQFRHWATPGFWLGMATGLAGTLVMLVAAPLAAWAYGRTELTGLILVLAIAPPLQALQIVSRASLQMEMRIKQLAMLGILTSLLTAALTIAGAALGLGAYSFVLPVPIVSIVVAVAGWRLARPPIRPRLEVSRWKYFIGDSAALGGTRVLQTLVMQGDYIGLGLAGIADAAIGTYFVAYKLSTQTFLLMANGVSSVMFPSLNHLALDPELQLRSTRRATRLLAMVAIPFCLLQILLAGPLIRLACPPSWEDAILPLQLLTAGMMLNAPCWPMQSLMMSQRRFGELFCVALRYTIVFAAMIAFALVVRPGIVSVATAVMLWYTWSAPYLYWHAARRKYPFYEYFAEIHRPLGAGLAAALPCGISLSRLADTAIADAIALAAVPVVFTFLFVVLTRRMAREDFNDFCAQVAPFWNRLRGLAVPRVDSAQSKVRR